MVALALACTGVRATVVLVNEQFADLERFSDAGPASLRWTSGAHHATAASAFTSLDASSGALVWDHSQSPGVNSFSGIWGHFTPAGSPLTLAVGDTLTLRAELTLSGGGATAGTNALRWSLFDSTGSRVTTDFAGTNATGLQSGTTFANWRGYVGQTTAATTEVAGNNFLARERAVSGNGLYTSSPSYIDVPGSAVDEIEFFADTLYILTLELVLTGAGMEVRAGVNGTFTNWATDTTPHVSFDTISFFVIDGLSHNLTLDNIRLTHVAVPEPGTFALLSLGLAGLLRIRVARR